MLDYESRGQGAGAILLTLNRGEGGQNVMSDDFWDALGLVRTEELLAAGRYYDVQQVWTTVAGFGVSEQREEGEAAGDHVGLRRRTHRWARTSCRCRANRAGSVRSGGRPEHVPRSDS